MNSPAPHREPLSIDPLGAFIGMWRLLWGRQLALKRLLLRGGLMLGFTLLTLIAIPEKGRMTDDIQAEIFYGWVVGFYFLILMPLTCLSVCGSMVREEASVNTLCFYTTRPLKRAEMFLLFYFGNVAWLQVLFGVLTLMVFGVAIIRGVDGLEALLPIFLITQFLALMAWGALCSMIGMAHQRYIVMGIVYGLLVEIGIANIPTNIANISLSHHIQMLLAHHNPLKVFFRLKDFPNANEVIMPITCLGIGTLLFLGIGALLFTLRELLPSQTEK